MFGYITVNQQELKIREYDMYRSYYCGLCHALKKRYGRIGQLLLNYDMTFAAMILSSLYEPETEENKRRCIPHPVLPHMERTNEAVGYAADMTVLLAYQKAEDDWHDDRNPGKLALSGAISGAYRKIRKRYPRQAICIEECVRKLSKLEKEGSGSLDAAAGLTGEFMGEILCWKTDIWQDDLRETGFYLGKYVYLADAYADLDDDRKRGRYNPFLAGGYASREGFEEEAEEILMETMGCCCRAFERLPLVDHVEILRNILYSGVWVRFAQARKQRMQRREKEMK